MVFPNWGAISANIINSQNIKNKGLVGSYRPTRKPTKKDLSIGILLMIIPAIIIWITLFYLLKY